VDLIIIYLKINLFLPWYSLKIAELALDNHHLLCIICYTLITGVVNFYVFFICHMSVTNNTKKVIAVIVSETTEILNWILYFWNDLKLNQLKLAFYKKYLTLTCCLRTGREWIRYIIQCNVSLITGTPYSFKYHLEWSLTGNVDNSLVPMTVELSIKR
jgi:hypothetical protein